MKTNTENQNLPVSKASIKPKPNAKKLVTEPSKEETEKKDKKIKEEIPANKNPKTDEKSDRDPIKVAMTMFPFVL